MLVGEPSSELHDPSDLTHALQLHSFFLIMHLVHFQKMVFSQIDFGLLNFMKVGELEVTELRSFPRSTKMHKHLKTRTDTQRQLHTHSECKTDTNVFLLLRSWKRIFV